jgi:hypothetical protein
MNNQQLKTLKTREKVLALKMIMDKNTPNIIDGKIPIKVNRETMIQDSIAIFKNMQHPLRALDITFDNEISQDVGGVSREYFYTIMKEMLTPGYGIFEVATTE